MTGARTRAIAAGAAVITALVAGIPSPATAGAGPGTECRFGAEFTITPGLSATPNSGSFRSVPGMGRVDCDGPVRGVQPTGTGSFSAIGRYGTTDPDSCLSGGEGTAVQFFVLPTTRGQLAFTNTTTFIWRPLPGPDGQEQVPLRRWLSGALISGRFEGDAGSGTFDVVALEGDCFTAPVTRVLFTARAVFAR